MGAERVKPGPLSCLLWVAAAGLPGTVIAAAPGVDPNAALRPVQIPGRGVAVPAGAFEETADVVKLCQPDSVREPVRDGANRSFVRQAEFQQVMRQGRQVAELSDAWARSLGTHLLMQRQLPGTSAGTLGIRLSQEMIDKTDWGPGRKPPQAAPTTVSPVQADMDYNFAVLEARRGELEAAAQAYLADLRQLELNTLRDIGTAGLSPAALLDVLKQFDRFRDDNVTCANNRLMGRKAMTALSQHGWPVSNQEQRPFTPAWHAQNKRSRQAGEQTDAEFERLAAVAIADSRPRVAAQILSAKEANELPRIMFTHYGYARLNELAMADADLRRSFDARSTALRLEEQKRLAEQQRKLAIEEEKRAAANRERIVANVKQNGPPLLADIQGLATAQSMQGSQERGQGAKVAQTSPTDYEVFAELLGQRYKIATVSIRLSDLSCKPQAGKQSCSYTETFDWTRYAMFESLVIPKATRTEKRSSVFWWTEAGLQASGDFETRTVGWTRSASSERGSDTVGDMFRDKQRQNDQETQDRYFNRLQRINDGR